MSLLQIKPSDIFNYLRGAVRGYYGYEEFRNKSIAFVGCNTVNTFLLTSLTYDPEITIYLLPSPGGELAQYTKAVSINPHIKLWDEEKIDILIDELKGCITVKHKTTMFKNIGKDPFNQGIHDFYL